MENMQNDKMKEKAERNIGVVEEEIENISGNLENDDSLQKEFEKLLNDDDIDDGYGERNYEEN